MSWVRTEIAGSAKVRFKDVGVKRRNSMCGREAGIVQCIKVRESSEGESEKGCNR